MALMFTRLVLFRVLVANKKLPKGVQTKLEAAYDIVASSGGASRDKIKKLYDALKNKVSKKKPPPPKHWWQFGR